MGGDSPPEKGERGRRREKEGGRDPSSALQPWGPSHSAGAHCIARTKDVLGLQRLVETQARGGPGGSKPLLFILFPLRNLELLGSFFFRDENVRAGDMPGCGP